MKDAAASREAPGSVRPYIRLPWERHRVAQSFSPEDDRTHQSFRDECDVNHIIDLHTRTGVVTHLNPGTAQYADVPESTLFDAAVAQAEIRSAIEGGWEPPEEPSEAPEAPEGATAQDEPEEAAEPPSEAADG